MPRMPHEMSNLNSQDLGNFMSQYAAWREYTEDVLVQANIRCIELENNYSHTKKVIWLSMSREKTVKDTEKRLDIDEEVVSLREELMEAEMYRDLLATKYESINNALTVLSREVTRRQGRKYED